MKYPDVSIYRNQNCSITKNSRKTHKLQGYLSNQRSSSLTSNINSQNLIKVLYLVTFKDTSFLIYLFPGNQNSELADDLI